MQPALLLLAAAALAVTHLFAAKLRFLDRIPRSGWLSAAGGVSVAYVFVHLLPELAEAQDAADEGGGRRFGAGVAGAEVWLLALAGLVAFYGLDRLVMHAETLGDPRREVGPGAGGETGGADSVEDVAKGKEASGHGPFWLHLSSFAVYNVITGAVMVGNEDRTPAGLGLFALAMALHFLVTDLGLMKAYRGAWTRIGRWALAAAVLLGAGVESLVAAPEALIDGVTAFLGGGVVLNVLKEELPEERRSRFGAFAAGVAGYAGLLLLV